MMLEGIHYSDHQYQEECSEIPNHEAQLAQLSAVATIQEAKIYAVFSQDWKAQLDPQLRQWMISVRKEYMKNQGKNSKNLNTTQSEPISCDNQTMDVQLDDYFQL